MKILYRRKEKGVSAVIGTILMVAITVVAAAAVFTYISGFFSSNPNKPSSLLLSESTNYAPNMVWVWANFTVTQGSVNVPFIVEIVNKTTGQMLYSIIISSINVTGPPKGKPGYEIPFKVTGVTPYVTAYINIYDNNQNGKLDTGDAFDIGFYAVSVKGTAPSLHTNILDQWEVQIIYNGQPLYQYQFDF
ncbi:MAG: archaellin/type IV pilin N-terminal domain-containing protein [Thermoplasmata archaeon]